MVGEVAHPLTACTTALAADRNLELELAAEHWLLQVLGSSLWTAEEQLRLLTHWL